MSDRFEDRKAELRSLAATNKLNFHDAWTLAIILAESFDGMIKCTGPRVVLHVKHKRAGKAKP